MLFEKKFDKTSDTRHTFKNTRVNPIVAARIRLPQMQLLYGSRYRFVVNNKIIFKVTKHVCVSNTNNDRIRNLYI